MPRLSRFPLPICLALVCASPTAVQAEKVCVEEVAGVCLKYGVKQAPRASSAAPSQQADGVRISRSERRLIQRGLAEAGVYSGAVDGLFGAQTRGAIRRWQANAGFASTGALTAAQARRLIAAGEAAAGRADSGSGSRNRPPVVGETYTVRKTSPRDAYTLKLTAASATSARLDFTYEGAAIALSIRKSCAVDPTKPVNCRLNGNHSTVFQIRGELPDLTVTSRGATGGLRSFDVSFW